MPKSVKCSERVTKRQENEKKKKKKKKNKKRKKIAIFYDPNQNHPIPHQLPTKLKKSKV
jgi:hypothetical protein